LEDVSEFVDMTCRGGGEFPTVTLGVFRETLEGVIHEVASWFGFNVPLHHSWDDIVANNEGIKCSYQFDWWWFIPYPRDCKPCSGIEYG